MGDNEIDSLRQYVMALEHENRSKGLQQEVLHRELQNLNEQLAEMQQYYFQNRELARTVDSLDMALQAKDEEIVRLTQLLDSTQEKSIKNAQLLELLIAEKKITEGLKKDLEQSLRRESTLKQTLDLEKTKSSQQKDWNLELKLLLDSREEELADLKVKVNKCEITNTSESHSAEKGDYFTLAKRYEELQEETEEREQKLKEMEDYIEELEFCCESLNNNIRTKEIELKQLRIELNYLEKQYKNGMIPIQKNSRDRFYRSQVSTPKWKDPRGLQRMSSTERSEVEGNQKQNYSVILRAPSDDGDLSERSSVKSMNEQANRLQKRNSILKRQNQMLLKGMAI